MRLPHWVVRQPTAIVSAVRMTLLALVALGLGLTPEQIVAIMLAVEAILGLVNWSLVTPNAAPRLELARPVEVAGTADSPPPDAVVARRSDIMPGTPTDALLLHREANAR